MTIEVTARDSKDEVSVRGPIADILRQCVHYAVTAPSPHNTQPWWFRVEDSSITVGLDPIYGLPVSDPLDREATMAVGAAVFMLRVALARYGLWTQSARWPDPKDPEAFVRLTAGFGRHVESELTELFDAIPHRRSSHAAFEATPLPTWLCDQLTDAIASEGASLRIISDRACRFQVGELIAQADREQMADRRFRRELATWLRRPRSRRRDGMFGFADSLTPTGGIAEAGPLAVRTFNFGDVRAAADQGLLRGSPLLAVITTASDERNEWLSAGQALARLHLLATLHGVSVGFLNQPIEVPRTREQLRRLIGGSGLPQLLVRLGYGPPSPSQPRRRASDFVVH